MPRLNPYPRSNPVRIFGESEMRLLGPTLAQMAAINSRRLRGRFVHRHKGKRLRQHALLPIRSTYQVEQQRNADRLVKVGEALARHVTAYEAGVRLATTPPDSEK